MTTRPIAKRLALAFAFTALLVPTPSGLAQKKEKKQKSKEPPTAEDLMVVDGLPGSPLDPSSSLTGTTSRMALDATRGADETVPDGSIPLTRKK